MPKYYVSMHLALEASTIYEVYDDGSYWCISPQGHQHLGEGGMRARLEVDADRALQLIAERITALKEHEKEESGPATHGPAHVPVEDLTQDGVITPRERARNVWRKDGWV